MNNSMNFSELLFSLLNKYNMTQAELAERSGATESSISLYLSGRRLPRLNTFMALMKAFSAEVQIVDCNDDTKVNPSVVYLDCV